MRPAPFLIPLNRIIAILDYLADGKHLRSLADGMAAGACDGRKPVRRPGRIGILGVERVACGVSSGRG